MSFENKNLYALLGNDVEDDVPAPAPKEIVKKTTSSKKADVPPPSADPAKAKKPAKKTTGNDAAFKNKNNNKSVGGPSATPSKHQKKPFDRHSRSGKTDSKKKVRQGWGGDDKQELEDEAAGAADAAAEVEADTSIAKGPATKSLQDYLAELQQAESQLEGRRPARLANQGSEEKWGSSVKIEKVSVPFVEAQQEKKVKQKAPKAKKFLDFNAVFGDSPAPKTQTKKSFKKDGKPTVDDKNFPSL